MLVLDPGTPILGPLDVLSIWSSDIRRCISQSQNTIILYVENKKTLEDITEMAVLIRTRNKLLNLGTAVLGLEIQYPKILGLKMVGPIYGELWSSKL